MAHIFSESIITIVAQWAIFCGESLESKTGFILWVLKLIKLSVSRESLEKNE